ncbi:MAG: hypothetical protein IKZ98_09005 [Clostridia bacterium]|nr:hypothetical protein [Clostridia bacterium]
MMTMATMNMSTMNMTGIKGVRRNSISAVMEKIALSLRSRLQFGSEARCGIIRNDCEEMMRRIKLMGWSAESNLVSRNIV